MNEFDDNSMEKENGQPETPAADTPAAETPAEETPAAEAAPSAEAPAEEPTAEAPAEEPTAEAPAAEEPIAEDTAAETSGDTEAETAAEAPADAAELEIPADGAAQAEAPADAPVEAPAAYRWTYAEQQAVDRQTAGGKGKKKTGIAVYMLIMAAVFAVSFGLLLGVVLMTRNDATTAPGTSHVSGDVLSDAEIGANMEKVKQSVVLIQVTTESGGGTGSGVVLNKDGYIATNHHVIEGAEKVKVTFYNGDKAYAEVIGSSEMDDLAVIKVDIRDLKHELEPAVFAEYSECYVCQTVLAIGAPAGEEFCWTTTKGIISYVDREVRKYNTDGTMAKKLRTLQTDANVNPGNSGGPLVDVYGRVVGIVSMKLVGDYEGMGFAIPSDGAQEILSAIIRDGNADKVNSSLSYKRPVLGIVGVYMEKDKTYIMDDNEGRIYEVTPEDDEKEMWNEIIALGGKPVGPIVPGASGIYVCSVTEGLGAYGVLEVGDVIEAVNGVGADSMNVLMDELNKHYAGDTVTLDVFRGGETFIIDMVLSAAE